jgi:hypothetical protein
MAVPSQVLLRDLNTPLSLTPTSFKQMPPGNPISPSLEVVLRLLLMEGGLMSLQTGFVERGLPQLQGETKHRSKCPPLEAEPPFHI